MHTLDDDTVNSLAEHLFSAQANAKPVVKITDAWPDLTYDDAYRIQDAVKTLHHAAGSPASGLKMGLTSYAKMKQMGVEVPIRGFLTQAMTVGDGREVDTSRLIHPKVEAELAFMLHRDLSGPGCSAVDVLSATDFVVPALEIIDSRYENFRFDLRSVIADNTSASHYVTGSTTVSPHATDLKTLGVVMYKNGEVVQTGAGAAVLGDPVMSVATLANMLGERGESIPANTLVLTGGITAAVRVEAGDHIVTRFQHLGELSVLFT